MTAAQRASVSQWLSRYQGIINVDVADRLGTAPIKAWRDRRHA